MHTQLTYMENMTMYTCSAQVTAVTWVEDKTIVELDQTIFYPQGGGQLYDTGNITSDSGKVFQALEVRFVDGIVKHIGFFLTEAFSVGESVRCEVDVPRRELHARLHSAGHVVDMGLKKLNIPWIPGKGYHFPDGPYVEYDGNLEEDEKEKIKTDLENACNTIISQNIPTHVQFMDKKDMYAVCAHVPEYLPEGKPGRIVLYGDFGVPCGGTHVANLADIKSIQIRKIKRSGDKIKVSYELDGELTR